MKTFAWVRICMNVVANPFSVLLILACNINDAEAVRLFADQVFKHATCFDDTLNCLYLTAKALAQAARRVRADSAASRRKLSQAAPASTWVASAVA